jgi:hypothetical protein
LFNILVMPLLLEPDGLVAAGELVLLVIGFTAGLVVVLVIGLVAAGVLVVAGVEPDDFTAGDAGRMVVAVLAATGALVVLVMGATGREVAPLDGATVEDTA